MQIKDIQIEKTPGNGHLLANVSVNFGEFTVMDFRIYKLDATYQVNFPPNLIVFPDEKIKISQAICTLWNKIR